MKKTIAIVLVIVLVMTVGAFAKKKSTTLNIISGGITIDGTTKDWKACGIKPVMINTKEQVAVGGVYWQGAKIHSAKVYVAFSEDTLYVGAVVKNSKGAKNKHEGREIYQGTTIELFLGFDNSEQDREMYMETDYQIGISTGQYSKKTKKWKVKPSAFGFNVEEPIKGAKIKVKTTSTGYILEAAIPADFFEGWDVNDGQEIGFEIGIDDVGKKGFLRKTQMTWTGDGKGWESPKNWGKAILKEKSCGE